MREGVVLFLFSVLAFLPFLARPTLYGFDPYYFMDALDMGLVQIKAVVFCVILASNYLLFRIAGKITSKPLWALVFAWSSPAWVVFLSKFENDLIALPFLLASLYFFLDKKDSIAFLCLVFAGLMYQGAIVWSLAYSVMSWPFLLFSLAVLAWQHASVYALFPTATVSESLPFVNSVYWFLLWIAPLFFLKKWRLGQLKRPSRAQKLLFVFILLGIFNGKFVAFAVPLMAAFLARIFEGLDSKRQLFLIFMAVFFVGHSLLDIYQGPPSEADLALIRAGVARADGLGEPFKNTWPVGYWVEHVAPGRSTARAGGSWPQDFNGATVAAHELFPGYSVRCRRLHGADNVHLWDC